ncbi:NAD(P)-dependent dehydrogenase (short-subunit alcohol dehydrogenase family) [Variovorax beijingensis]|uniref:NAD(P)-dependent dehydrogenase (Short-subunit alcohol dehydrogenase family) n=2 Tax=Variovorax TaxID=34072 RepID=A0AAE3Y3U5_VARPD|nr:MULTISPECIES: SDR family oxidoreductase [Variovorax]MDR6428873.1 NAD(P)-dependent dehydrogenase (short-subunit alcohol dehydrogenase family) [Variovorax paradoxus]TWD77140.1 NAD(P)-dependent dehydrogenase (short-subunit alcohol dehydrogenase family) [Variovorax beijingensis]
MNTNILQNKVIVVTGAASGIGRAIAVNAARHGAKAVIVSDISREPREGGTPTTDEIEALGVATAFVKADVSKKEEVDALVDASAPFGGVDVMVANAGITLRSDGFDVSSDDLRKLMAVNLDGTLFSAQAAARQMKANGKQGSIILMASMGGLAGAGITVAYSTSKGGVVLMAKSLADALGPDGIRVNAVAPGTIDTHLLRTSPGIAEAAEGFRQRTPLRRLGQPSEIGDAVAFLGSDLSSYITGTALLVDGGLLAVI